MDTINSQTFIQGGQPKGYFVTDPWHQRAGPSRVSRLEGTWVSMQKEISLAMESHLENYQFWRSPWETFSWDRGEPGSKRLSVRWFQILKDLSKTNIVLFFIFGFRCVLKKWRLQSKSSNASMVTSSVAAAGPRFRCNRLFRNHPPLYCLTTEYDCSKCCKKQKEVQL